MDNTTWDNKCTHVDSYILVKDPSGYMSAHKTNSNILRCICPFYSLTLLWGTGQNVKLCAGCLLSKRLSPYFTATPGGDKQHRGVIPRERRESPHIPHTVDPPSPIMLCLPVNPTQRYLISLWIDDVGAHAKVWGILDVAPKPRSIMNEKPLPKLISN